MNTQPLVSCIMPTYNRRQFVPQAIEYFLRQDYPEKELVILDDGDDSVADLIPDDPRIRYLHEKTRRNIGAKRNTLCAMAQGELIVHWDDDDWHAAHRLRYQAEALIREQADVCGVRQMLFYDRTDEQIWLYEYPETQRAWLAGGSLMYSRDFWKRTRFSEVQIGEDTRFVWHQNVQRITTLPDFTFYVALIHSANTSSKVRRCPYWSRWPGDINAIIGNDVAWLRNEAIPLIYPLLEKPVEPPVTIYNNNNIHLVSHKDKSPVKVDKPNKVSSSDYDATLNRPLVSCIMATRDRPKFVSQAIRYYQHQDYPNKELIILDDGTQSIQKLMPDDSSIRYIRLDQPMSLGQKRNLAVKASRGDFIAHWDDDDWYAPNRLQSQLMALLSAKAKICGLYGGLIYDIERNQYWTIKPELHSKMHYADIHGRSIMYSRDVWEKYACYPDRSLGEDAGFLKNAMAKGAGLVRLQNDRLLIYIRHGQNTWQFRSGCFIDPAGWQSAEVPEYLSIDELDFYRQFQTQQQASCLSTSIAPSPQLPEPQHSDCHVTVSIPYHGCADTLRRAVESILGQTHKDLTLVVVNDGDTSPWKQLDNIKDPRLVCFDLKANHGRYFADAVVLNAAHSPYFMVQDADDWSEPDRIAVLLHRLRVDHAAGAISAEYVHHSEKSIAAVNIERYPALNEALGETFRHRANHHGLYRTAALRSIGGYYGGFRIGYDTLLVNLLQMIGRLTYVEAPYYHRLMRPDSLSNAAATGMYSRTRQEVAQRLGRMYNEAFRAYQAYIRGEQDYTQLCSAIRTTCRRHIQPEEWAALELETDRLCQQLQLGGASKPTQATSFQGNTNTSIVDDPSIHWTDWSLDKDFAKQMIAKLKARQSKYILEVGTGATTFLLAEFAAQTGAHFVSLEHDESYYEKTKTLLDRLGLLNYVDLRLAPLEPYRCANGRDYPWYRTEFTNKFDFVLLDGPPERYGRQAGLFALQSCLAGNWSIWLHDGNRPHEKACIALWQEYYPFVSTLSQADPKGVFCLNSPQGTGAFIPEHKHYSSGIGIALLTGDRPELLRQTVESFSEYYPDTLQTSVVVAMVNGRDQKTEHYLQELPFVDCVLSYPYDVLPIGTAASYLAYTLAKFEKVEFIFHLEDDWLSCFKHQDFLQKAQDILRVYPNIGQVRLRHQSERVLSRNMVTHEPIRWIQQKGFRFSPEAHFTFNPNLMRVADLNKIYPAETEHEAQVKFHRARFAGAQLFPGCFQHIGACQSRRAKLRMSCKSLTTAPEKR